MADKMKKVLILGKGRIGKAVEYYLKKDSFLRIDFFSDKTKIEDYSLLLGALAGEEGEKSLKLALRFGKDLIDISDVGYDFYLKYKKKIKEKGILVIPGCGFSPGLTNFICGREATDNDVREIEILAGTLSPKKFFFPFTWCFEDLIEGHKSKATLVRDGKKIKVEPFINYKKENIEGIEAESYLADGLDSLSKTLKVDNMSYRVLRPLGFFDFFRYLSDYGFLKKKNIDFTKKILESRKEDNLSIGIVKIKTKNEEISWKMKTFSKKNEKMNSMQKITSVFPVSLIKVLLKEKFGQKGLIFPEELGKDKKLFDAVIKLVRKDI